MKCFSLSLLSMSRVGNFKVSELVNLFEITQETAIHISDPHFLLIALELLMSLLCRICSMGDTKVSKRLLGSFQKLSKEHEVRHPIIIMVIYNPCTFNFNVIVL
jgi:hypothetical protein